MPVNRQNNFGFSLGGPVYIPRIYDGRDKTFWHASAEYYRYKQQPLLNSLPTVPTALAKQGNFSEYAAVNGVPNVIYVPQGVNCNGLTPGTPFLIDIIPANCISPLSASLLSQVPDPSLNSVVNNINSQIGVLPFSQDSWGFNVDHNFTQKQSVHYSQWRDIYSASLVDNNAYFNSSISGFKIELGFETRRAFQDDHEQNDAGGGFYFSSLTTSNGIINGLTSGSITENNTGNGFASFLLGQVDHTFRRQALETKLRNFSISPYINDDVKITPKFTVNAGLRWDILVPFTVDQPQNFTYLDLTRPNPGAIGPNGPLLGAASSLGSTSPLSAGVNRANTSFKNFGPRAGFSYQIGQKTVISSGFALTFLNGGAYEFGSSKAALNYGNILSGVVQTTSSRTNVPAYGSWDANQLAAPQTTPLTATLGNGRGVLHPFFTRGIRQPYSEQYSLTVQRELPWNLYTTISYVGNHGVHLPSALNPTNQLDPRYTSTTKTITKDCLSSIRLHSPIWVPMHQEMRLAKSASYVPRSTPTKILRWPRSFSLAKESRLNFVWSSSMS